MNLDDYIEPNEHGRPKLKGRRIRVQDVVIAYHHWGFSKIMTEYRLTREQIDACMSYYWAHQSEIDAAIEADHEAAKGLPSLTDLLDD